MDNQIAKILRIIGIFEIFAGFLLGFILGSTNWSVVLMWWAMGFISGMIFLGFSEIINLLHSINLKLYDFDKTEYYGMKNNKETVKDKGKSEIYNSIMNDEK